jgi:hypothetical protein
MNAQLAQFGAFAENLPQVTVQVLPFSQGAHVDVTVQLPPDLDVFFRDIETPGADWLEAEKALADAIRAAADTRAGDDPDEVITFLVLQQRAVISEPAGVA